MHTGNRNNRILFIIVFSQFACTSLWFAGNAVLPDLLKTISPVSNAMGNITAAVQFGFIIGTLLFALLTISDRYSPSKVFFYCAIAGAFANGIIFFSEGVLMIGASRFITGICLAGIYPVGMKIASDYHNKGLGKALGYLVGALVLGTALPHLVKTLTQTLSWKYVITATSALSVIGGCLILFLVPDGPYRTKGNRPDFSAFYLNFRNKDFHSAALGYFGHMWELYTFWAFIPAILLLYIQENPATHFNVSTVAFFIIASGFIGCIAGGYICSKYGSARTASAALLISFLCCLISPFLFHMPFFLFLVVMLIWGMSVVADSPQFSTLIAQLAYAESKGTALTIVNCIGFSITIISIQVFNALCHLIHPQYVFLILAVGPLLGLFSIRKISFKNLK